MKISVVIPAHNEQDNLKKMVRLLFSAFRKHINQLVIVDDCSDDNTTKILKQLSKSNSKVTAVYRRTNPGVGNAIREGYRNIKNSSDYVLSLDCDFLENSKDIKRMISEIKFADGLLGSRYLRESKMINYPLLKKIANRLFHLLLRVLLQFPHKDVTNNFKLYRKEIIDKINPYLMSSGFSINAETGIYPVLLGYKLKEVPVSWIGRTAEMGFSDFRIFKAGPGYIKVLMDILKSKKSFTKNIINLESRERNHFDDLVKKTGETYYGNLRPVASIRFNRKADAILNLIKKHKNPRVLEIGCGTGILSKYLLAKRPTLNIEGIDISPEAISIAKRDLKKYKNANFRIGNGFKLSYKSHRFDYVIGNSVIHHLPLDLTLSEIKRVLKPGGRIWFCEPNALNPQIAMEKNIPLIKAIFQDSEDEKAFFKWQLKDNLEKSGFQDVEVRPYEFLHPLIPKDLFFILVPLALWLEKIPIFREFAGTLMIVGSYSKD